MVGWASACRQRTVALISELQKRAVMVQTIVESGKPSWGLTLFYTDLDRTQVEVKEIPKMGRGAVDSNTLFFDGWRLPGGGGGSDRRGGERL